MRKQNRWEGITCVSVMVIDSLQSSVTMAVGRVLVNKMYS